MSDGQPTRAGRHRVLAGASLLVYVGVLVAFALPFVSISCSDSERTVRTGRLTGWNLVFGTDPGISSASDGALIRPSDSTGAEEAVRNALRSVRRTTRIEAAVVVVALALALAATARGAPRQLALPLIIFGSVAAVGFLFVLTAGSDAEGDATVHHHGGLFIAWGLCWLAFAFEVWLMFEIDRRFWRRPPVAAA